MDFLDVSHAEGVATLTLQRGKVNAVNATVVHELQQCLRDLERDAQVRAVVLTGQGKFFSFGLDVPELYPLPKDVFARFLHDFTDLYTEIYLYPKPVIAALNGHAIAGGCMLALACDRRLMVTGNAKIALNEITFGSAVFAGSVAMLRACVGERRAEKVLLTGKMVLPAEALALGLVDRVISGEHLMPCALAEARSLSAGAGMPWAAIKRLLREPIAEEMRRREGDSIREFVEIWYSAPTREQLQRIEIRG